MKTPSSRPDLFRPDSGREDELRAEPDRADGRKPVARVDNTPTEQDVAHVTDMQMRMILDLSRMLAVPTDLDTLLCKIAEYCTHLLNCERASIFIHDPATHQLWTKVAIGSNEIRVPCTAGIVGAAFSGNCLVHVAEPYQDSRFNPEFDRKTGFVTRNLLSVPMADLDSKPMGVVQAVNKRGGGFGEQDQSLGRLLAEQAGIAIQRHTLQLQAIEALALKHEMDLARRTQQAMIPKEPPNVPGLKCAGWTLPASVTGGDCFDFWAMPDGRLGILVADASGHGLGPALVVSQARTLVRALSELISDPHEVLIHVNSRLADDLDWGQFVTAFLGYLSPDGTLQWSSAGHGPLLVRRSPELPLETMDPPVQPLGVVLKWFDGAPAPVTIEPGGQLILTSDGIFEASDPAGEQMGLERMSAVADDHRASSPDELLGAIRNFANEWCKGADPLDDQTIVIVRRE